jgi:chorismate mutase/prephenate dehydratase
MCRNEAESIYEPGTDELDSLRAQINGIDDEIILLFNRRMLLARKVAGIKAATGGPVYDQTREESILERARQKCAGNDGLRAETLMRSLMRLSRGAQYDQLRITDENFQIGRLLENAGRTLPASNRAVYQGTPSSYSARACSFLFPDAQTNNVQTFANACQQVSEEKADLAVLPLENTTAGTVDDVYDLLLQHNLNIWQSVSLQIQHRLLALPGTQLSEIREVISHPQALAQCSDAIRRHGWQVRESLNTAYAAEAAAGQNNRQIAAIASDEAAANYNLEVLLPDICNTPHNQTRFIVAGKKPVVLPDADRISLVIRLPHRSGSLTSTLSIFSDRGLNLSKIQSRPDPQQPWTYLFYLDVDCKAGDPEALSALYQLSLEMPYLRLLGWYREIQA